MAESISNQYMLRILQFLLLLLFYSTDKRKKGRVPYWIQVQGATSLPGMILSYSIEW